MARALSFATVRSDDAKYIVLSPCSTGHRCQGGNTFAAYAKANRSFFFAEDIGGAGAKYFPERAGWPGDLTPVVDEWLKGEMRD